MMINSVILRFWMQLSFLLVACVLTVSCVPLEGSRRPASVGSLPEAHVWQYLYSYGDEEYDYATYSYVLVGRDESNQTATAIYLELVKAIQGSTANSGSIPYNVSNANFNLFLIPAVSNTNYATKKPNYELSKLLLASLSTESPLKFSQPGPYIITLYQPISFGGQDGVADILYVDLTNIHKTAIPEIVRAYKNKVLDENINGIEKLHSLRLALLNIALITEDSIGFAQAAYAGLKSSFFE